MDDTRELMNTAMQHNHKILSTVLKSTPRALAPQPQPQTSGFPSALPSPTDRKAILDRQFQDQVKKLQQKYVGKITPKRMQEIHASTNIAPGAAMSPSSPAIQNRVLSNATSPQ
jgi:hypothetical protein